jgi:hypothetical protein
LKNAAETAEMPAASDKIFDLFTCSQNRPAALVQALICGP